MPTFFRKQIGNMLLTKLRVSSWTRRSLTNVRWYSDDEKSEKKENKLKGKKEPTKEREIKSKDSVNRLASLLESMSPKNMKADIKIPSPPEKKKRVVELKPNTQAEKLEAVTEAIAKQIGGDVKQTQTELLSKLLGTSSKPSGSLSDLISGMKVEKNEPIPQRRRDERKPDEEGRSYSRADSVRQSVDPNKWKMQRRTQPSGSAGVVDLFGAKPLGIFNKASETSDILQTWSKLQERELKLVVTHPPANYFEKMIQWTDQGKLWTFPINNEQGMEEEKAVDFSEHVLLENHLDGWCPQSGPVRHFMELVCVGLSKNHWYTAKEKKEHIFWYRDYFEEKKDLLGELMLMGKGDAPRLEV